MFVVDFSPFLCSLNWLEKGLHNANAYFRQDLRVTSSETRIALALRNALESEAELTESDGADERLLTLLGLRGSRTAQQAKARTEEPSPNPKKPDRPGKRSPGRDATGQEPDEDSSKPLSDEEKAG